MYERMHLGIMAAARVLAAVFLFGLCANAQGATRYYLGSSSTAPTAACSGVPALGEFFTNCHSATVEGLVTPIKPTLSSCTGAYDGKVETVISTGSNFINYTRCYYGSSYQIAVSSTQINTDCAKPTGTDLGGVASADQGVTSACVSDCKATVALVFDINTGSNGALSVNRYISTGDNCPSNLAAKTSAGGAPCAGKFCLNPADKQFLGDGSAPGGTGAKAPKPAECVGSNSGGVYCGSSPPAGVPPNAGGAADSVTMRSPYGNPGSATTPVNVYGPATVAASTNWTTATGSSTPTPVGGGGSGSGDGGTGGTGTGSCGTLTDPTKACLVKIDESGTPSDAGGFINGDDLQAAIAGMADELDEVTKPLAPTRPSPELFSSSACTSITLHFLWGREGLFPTPTTCVAIDQLRNVAGWLILVLVAFFLGRRVMRSL